MALTTVTEFFGLHLTPEQKQNLRIASAMKGYATMSEYARDVLDEAVAEVLKENGVKTPPRKRNPQPMR